MSHLAFACGIIKEQSAMKQLMSHLAFACGIIKEQSAMKQLQKRKEFHL